jgi:hypothetical protein
VQSKTPLACCKDGTVQNLKPLVGFNHRAHTLWATVTAAAAPEQLPSGNQSFTNHNLTITTENTTDIRADLAELVQLGTLLQQVIGSQGRNGSTQRVTCALTLSTSCLQNQHMLMLSIVSLPSTALHPAPHRQRPPAEQASTKPRSPQPRRSQAAAG